MGEVMDSAVFVGGATTADAGELAHPVNSAIRKRM
jgi:hypothetical protein